MSLAMKRFFLLAFLGLAKEAGAQVNNPHAGSMPEANQAEGMAPTAADITVKDLCRATMKAAHSAFDADTYKIGDVEFKDPYSLSKSLDLVDSVNGVIAASRSVLLSRVVQSETAEGTRSYLMSDVHRIAGLSDTNAFKEALTYLDDEAASRRAPSAAAIRTLRARLAERERPFQMAHLRRASNFFCGMSYCRNPESFKRSFEWVLDFNDPGVWKGNYVSFPETLEEVLTDPIYASATSCIVSLLNKRMQETVGGDFSGRGKLFELVQACFVGAGQDHSAAGHSAMKWLGIYGSRGASPNILGIAEGVGKGTMEGMGLAANMISFLDRVYNEKGLTAFSLPSEVESSCDYTRPYHFWKAAFIGYEARRRGLNPDDTVLALNHIGTLYEAFAPVSTNALDSQALLRLSLDSVGLTSKRLDVVHNDLGALWGSRLETRADGFATSRLAMIDGDSYVQDAISEAKPAYDGPRDARLGRTLNPLRALYQRAAEWKLNDYYDHRARFGTGRTLDSMLNFLEPTSGAFTP
jgi:hypothetical protein